MANGSESAGKQHWWSSSWFKLVLSVLLLGVLLYTTDLRDLGATVAEARPAWVLLGLAGYLASNCISALRWAMLARPLGFDEPLSHFFGSYFTGVYMNLFAPSTVAGDIGRALYLAGGQRRKALAFTTVLADRALGFIVLVWIAALAVVLQQQYRLPRPLYYSAWIVPPATLAGWLFLPTLVVRVLGRENRWRVLVERDLAPYWRDAALLFRTSLVAFVFHVMQVCTQICLARALDIRVPWPFFFIFVPAVNILGMVPISFSGVGVREAGYMYFLRKAGVMKHTGVALGLLASAVVLATGLLSGLVFLLWRAPTSVADPSAIADQGGGDR